MSKTRRRKSPLGKERTQRGVVKSVVTDYCPCGCGRVTGSHKVVRVVEL